MKKIFYDGQWFNLSELAEYSGIKYTTLCNRLRRGYTVEDAVHSDARVPDSVKEFMLASHPPDWDGMNNEELYKIYFNWCMKNGFTKESKIYFLRSLRQLLPSMRIVTTRVKEYGEVHYRRIIRVDGWFDMKGSK